MKSLDLKINLQQCLDLGGKILEVPSVPILDKIVQYHCIPMSEIREEIGVPIYVSLVYRSAKYEIAQGRSGNSKHTFPPDAPEGAGDYTVLKAGTEPTPNTRQKMFEMAQKMVQKGFKRLAFYPNKFFIHADYANTGRVQLFISDDASKWSNVTPEQFYSKILGDH